MSQNPEPSAVTQYLVALTYPRPRDEVTERLLQTAANFFDLMGGAVREDVGCFVRSTRGEATETLKLVSFVVEARVANGGHLAFAKRLDGALKLLLEAVKADGATARVFVAQGEAAL